VQPEMSDYYGRLANCTLHGIEFTAVKKPNGELWKVRNLIRLKVGGFEIELYQNPNLPANLGALRGERVDTTELFVREGGEKRGRSLLLTQKPLTGLPGKCQR